MADTKSRLLVFLFGAEMTCLPLKNDHQIISLKAFVIFIVWTQISQDWTSEIKCQFCLQEATPQCFRISTWDLRPARSENVTDLRAAAQSAGAKDKEGERRKEQTDQLSLLFVSPCYRKQDWGFLFSVSHRAKRWRPPFFECMCVCDHCLVMHVPHTQPGCHASHPSDTPLTRTNHRTPGGDGSFLHTAWLKSKIYEACPQCLCPCWAAEWAIVCRLTQSCACIHTHKLCWHFWTVLNNFIHYYNGSLANVVIFLQEQIIIYN